MTIVFFILLAVLVIIIVRSRNLRGYGRTGRVNGRFFQKVGMPPTNLVPSGHPCEPLVRRLEQSLPSDYEHQLRQRVLTEHAELSEEEWAWRWIEMKRYLLMCALFRQMPMFSSRVDDIWHEMLMFTREYQQFCDRFYGYMLHHSPHGGSLFQPDQRALFDWAYAELFPITRANAYVWAGFFQYPLDKDMMNNMLAFNPHQAEYSLFNGAAYTNIPEARDGIDYLIQRFRAHSQAVLDRIPPNSRTDRSRQDSSADSSYVPAYADSYGLGTASAAAVYYSHDNPWSFSSVMNPHLPPDVQQQYNNSGSSCGTGYSATNDTYGHHSHHGHDHSSGSSCSSSSCSGGSSCSSGGSSCGGGGGE
ncbi:glycine-rich domain-containing protein [Paenibacillus shenyangensis]|uniref:hypothetical protein n=1 Tax=Paenibacillus sp. A9 TaxID=1284352 RepID=UPI000376B815|nr:hypothetical protein [Paenibacillus sp. A9]